METLENTIKYTFKNKELLKTALIHKSYLNSNKTKDESCNERLEFLGDSVLSIITSEYLYRELPDRPEGELSNIRREIVDSEALAAFARELDLGTYMFFGNGEERNGGRDRRSNLEDAFEALVAAIYLDGGLESARRFLHPRIEAKVKNIFATHKFNDPKSLLQEIVQQSGEIVKYEKISESGPDHDKRFTCVVMVNSNILGTGEGRRIQEAEMNAARDALKLFGEKGN